MTSHNAKWGGTGHQADGHEYNWTYGGGNHGSLDCWPSDPALWVRYG